MIKPFRIRCSAIGKIMGGSMELSATDSKELLRLTTRRDEIANGADKKPFKDQDKKIEELLEKKAKKESELPQGAKTYVEDWLKGKLYDKKKLFSNRYTEKGNELEDDAIDYVVEQLELGWAAKNERSENNEYTYGTCDVELLDTVIDTKCSYSCFSFPLFEKPTLENINKDYYWQLQGYCWLYDKPKAILAYVLMDATGDMIWNEVNKRKYWKTHEHLTEDDIYEEVKEEFTYSHLPDKLRIKIFEFDRDDKAIEQIKKRVLLCRNYVKELLGEKRANIEDVVFETELAA